MIRYVRQFSSTNCWAHYYMTTSLASSLSCSVYFRFNHSVKFYNQLKNSLVVSTLSSTEYTVVLILKTLNRFYTVVMFLKIHDELKGASTRWDLQNEISLYPFIQNQGFEVGRMRIADKLFPHEIEIDGFKCSYTCQEGRSLNP